MTSFSIIVDIFDQYHLWIYLISTQKNIQGFFHYDVYLLFFFYNYNFSHVILLQFHVFQEDRILNESRKPATKKLTMLPQVIAQLQRVDLIEHFLDNGVLTIISTWLSPLPDNSLPSLSIRSALIQVLRDVSVPGFVSLFE